MADDWTINHFSQSNPAGDEQGDVLALLRRVADSIEKLGEVQIQDVTFSSQIDHDGKDDLTVTVYYHRGEGSYLSLVR